MWAPNNYFKQITNKISLLHFLTDKLFTRWFIQTEIIVVDPRIVGQQYVVLIQNEKF